MRTSTTTAVMLALLQPGCLIEEPACQEACERAEACGLLPSLLGAAHDDIDRVDNCTRRCAVSSKEKRDPMLLCLNSELAARSDELEAESWCEPDSTCSQIAQCLGEHLPGSSILGVTPVSVRARSAACDADAVEDGRSRDSRGQRLANSCQTPSMGSSCDFREETVETLCQRFGIQGVSAFVESNTEHTSGPQRGCIEGLLGVFTFPAVPPGRRRAGLRFFGEVALTDAGVSLDDDAPREPYCVVARSPDFVLRADDPVVVQVPLPVIDETTPVATLRELDSCEFTEEDCHDGLDNDGDGYRDCADLACRDVCLEPVREICDDDVDNDEDGAVDCEQASCADTTVCVDPRATVAAPDASLTNDAEPPDAAPLDAEPPDAEPPGETP